MLGTCLALAACLATTTPSAAAAEAAQGDPIPVLIVSGANNHDWEWTSPELERMLEEGGRFQADIAYDPGPLEHPELLAQYAAIVLDYNGPRWGALAEQAFLDAVRGGTGVVVIHAANNAFPGWTEYEELVGYLWRDGTGHGRVHEFDVTVLDREHAVTCGTFDLRAHPDELYHGLWKAPGTNHRVLATAWSSTESGGTGRAEPMITVGSYGEGRVFHTPLGHVWKGQEASRASFLDPQFRALVVRGTEWAATGACSGPSTTLNRLSEAERAAGWKLLFDGQGTDGWLGFKRDAFPQQGWSVADGALVCSSGGGDLVTAGAYGDFELDFEWRVSPKANSGVIYRVSDQGNATYESGPEYQVLDDAYFGDEPQPLHAAGALYALAAAGSKTLRPVGEFNRGKIVVRGWSIEHWLNGELLVACDLASPDGQRRVAESKFAGMPLFAGFERGRIALQDHGDAVAYRDLKIRELGGADKVRLFNGKDLSGWEFHLADGTPPEQVWSVDGEGNLVCKGVPPGYIMTDRDWESFVLELDWRWDPVEKKAGNSGVLLRKVGEDKVWPRSLEAQLMSGNAGDFWMIGEFPARTDPARTSGRNAKKTHANENPVGEWNHYRITVDGGTVTLEVNGQVLNQATDVLVVPGRICLQSEGVPIHFRNIELTPL